MPRPVVVVSSLLVVAGLAVGGYFAYEHFRAIPAPENAGPPKLDPNSGKFVDPATGKPVGKLVVLVVFDQMRGDYIAKWAEHFGTGGRYFFRTNRRSSPTRGRARCRCRHRARAANFRPGRRCRPRSSSPPPSGRHAASMRSALQSVLGSGNRAPIGLCPHIEW